MSSQPVAIVLGGTNPHIALIKNLQGRGYRAVLIDYYENPPAAKFADEHLRESTLDQEKVLEIAQKLDAKLVISACIDQANVTACYVAEKLGLPKPYSYATSLNVTDKSIIKKMMLEGGIPTSKYIVVDQVDDPRVSSLKLPLVVKPSDCTGSKGVRKAATTKELNEYLAEALVISRAREAIVEEFNEGIEVQADFFVKDNVASLIMIRKKLKVVCPEGSVLQSFGSVIPCDLSPEVHSQIVQIADKIVTVFNLENTSLFFQAIVNGDRVDVVEFAARIGGGLSYRMIQEIAGFDILEATIDSFLGLPVEINYHHPERCYSTVIIYARPGVFDSITGYEELLDAQCIEEFFIFKTQGMTVGEEMTSNNRIGAFLAKADNRPELLEKLQMAIDKLEILNADGELVMRKDIYDKLEV